MSSRKRGGDDSGGGRRKREKGEEACVSPEERKEQKRIPSDEEDDGSGEESGGNPASNLGVASYPAAAASMPQTGVASDDAKTASYMKQRDSEKKTVTSSTTTHSTTTEKKSEYFEESKSGIVTKTGDDVWSSNSEGGSPDDGEVDDGTIGRADGEKKNSVEEEDGNDGGKKSPKKRSRRKNRSSGKERGVAGKTGTDDNEMSTVYNGFAQEGLNEMSSMYGTIRRTSPCSVSDDEDEEDMVDVEDSESCVSNEERPQLSIRDEMQISFGMWYGEAVRAARAPNFFTRAMEAVRFTLLYQAYLEGGKSEFSVDSTAVVTTVLTIDKIKSLAEIKCNRKNEAYVTFQKHTKLFAQLRSHVNACHTKFIEREQELGFKAVPITEKGLWRGYRNKLVDGFLTVRIMERLGYNSVADIEALVKAHGEGMNRTTLFDVARMWAPADRGKLFPSPITSTEKAAVEIDVLYEELSVILESTPPSKLSSLEREVQKKARAEDFAINDQQSLLLVLIAAKRGRLDRVSNGRVRKFRARAEEDLGGEIGEFFVEDLPTGDPNSFNNGVTSDIGEDWRLDLPAGKRIVDQQRGKSKATIMKRAPSLSEVAGLELSEQLSAKDGGSMKKDCAASAGSKDKIVRRSSRKMAAEEAYAREPAVRKAPVAKKPTEKKAAAKKAIAMESLLTKRRLSGKNGLKKPVSECGAILETKPPGRNGSRAGRSGKKGYDLTGEEVPKISGQVCWDPYNISIVAEDLHEKEKGSVGKEYCSPSKNVKRFVIAELAPMMVMTMADSSEMPHGTLSTAEAFGILEQESDKLGEDQKPLSIGRVVPTTTFLKHSGDEVTAGPVQVAYGGSDGVYERYFGELRMDLGKLVEYLLSKKPTGLRKFSASFGFMHRSYDTRMRSGGVLTNPNFLSMERVPADLRKSTCQILDAMQECVDEVMSAPLKIYNDICRTEFVRSKLLEVEGIRKSRFEGWSWVLTSASVILARHTDKANCREQEYRTNCVWSCIYQYWNSVLGKTELLRMSLVGYSRVSIGAYIRKKYKYSHDLGEKLEAVLGNCGVYENLVNLADDKWAWVDAVNDSVSEDITGGSVLNESVKQLLVKKTAPYIDQCSFLSSIATLMRSVCERLLPGRKQRVALLYVACMAGSAGKVWYILSGWLENEARVTRSGSWSKFTEFDIMEKFWEDAAKQGWTQFDSGLAVTLGWTANGNWRCLGVDDAEERTLALSVALEEAGKEEISTNEILDQVAKSASGFANCAVAARLFPLAVLGGIEEGKKFIDRAAEVDNRPRARHMEFLKEEGAKLTRHRTQFVNAVSKKFNLQMCSAANLIVMAGVENDEECHTIMFHGQDLFRICNDRIVWKKEWNSCQWIKLEGR